MRLYLFLASVTTIVIGFKSLGLDSVVHVSFARDSLYTIGGGRRRKSEVGTRSHGSVCIRISLQREGDAVLAYTFPDMSFA